MSDETTEREPLTITLSAEDLEQIQGWYCSAAGESTTTDGSPEQNRMLKRLLERFGFEAHCGDEWAFSHEEQWKVENASRYTPAH